MASISAMSDFSSHQASCPASDLRSASRCSMPRRAMPTSRHRWRHRRYSVSLDSECRPAASRSGPKAALCGKTRMTVGQHARDLPCNPTLAGRLATNASAIDLQEQPLRLRGRSIDRRRADTSRRNQLSIPQVPGAHRELRRQGPQREVGPGHDGPQTLRILAEHHEGRRPHRLPVVDDQWRRFEVLELLRRQGHLAAEAGDRRKVKLFELGDGLLTERRPGGKADSDRWQELVEHEGRQRRRVEARSPEECMLLMVRLQARPTSLRRARSGPSLRHQSEVREAAAEVQVNNAVS